MTLISQEKSKSKMKFMRLMFLVSLFALLALPARAQSPTVSVTGYAGYGASASVVGTDTDGILTIDVFPQYAHAYTPWVIFQFGVKHSTVPVVTLYGENGASLTVPATVIGTAYCYPTEPPPPYNLTMFYVVGQTPYNVQSRIHLIYTYHCAF